MVSQTRLQRAMFLAASALKERDLCLAQAKANTDAAAVPIPGDTDPAQLLKDAEGWKMLAHDHEEYAAMFQELVDMYKARGDKVPESASGGCACDGTCGSCSCSAHDHEDIKGQQPV